MNATYYSALGEDDRRMLLARAIQLFMPGKPQVWYLDLFAGKNDYAAMERAGAGGHKEINRTNLSKEDMAAGLEKPVVQKQLELLKMRATYPVFGPDAQIAVTWAGSKLSFTWENAGQKALLDADFSNDAFTISITDAVSGSELYRMEQ